MTRILGGTPQPAGVGAETREGGGVRSHEGGAGGARGRGRITGCRRTDPLRCRMWQGKVRDRVLGCGGSRLWPDGEERKGHCCHGNACVQTGDSSHLPNVRTP